METLPSLESLLPQYETTLPFSQEKVTFTPFRVKDAKNISIILQEENKKFALNAMVELLKTNTKGVNILNLCLADAEFLFLQIRSKSVDERLNLIHNNEKIQVYIFDIKHRNELTEQKVQLTNDTYIVVETPKIKDLIKLQQLDKESFIKAAITKVVVKNEIYHLNKYVSKDIETLIDNMPMSVIPALDGFFKQQPELYIMLETKDGAKEVSGLLSFFTSR